MKKQLFYTVKLLATLPFIAQIYNFSLSWLTVIYCFYICCLFYALALSEKQKVKTSACNPLGVAGAGVFLTNVL